MQKPGILLLFLSLTGLFTGLFFCTCLSSENTTALSALLLHGITTAKDGFLQRFLTSLSSNGILYAMMLPALLSRFLRPLPLLVLCYKNFAVGFCSGLIWSGTRSHTLLLSLLHILPQNLFLLPGFFLCALALISCAPQNTSGARHSRTNQKSNLLTDHRLLSLLLLSALLTTAGALTEAVLPLAALSPS